VASRAGDDAVDRSFPLAADADRHLLFGLIALEAGLIDQAQLKGAFEAWARDRTRSLADHLAERGGLKADGRAVIDAMVDLQVKMHGGNTILSLASIPSTRTTCDSLAQIGAPVLEATLALVGSGATVLVGDAGRTPSSAVGAASKDGQRFRVLRRHARGGLGEVFVALDSELHREVALKQILDSHADDPVSRRRFLLEAEITGGLEHPGIVPVYGLGTHDDGRPYYAMRFIEGDSLKEAIERFHSSGEPGDRVPGLNSTTQRSILATPKPVRADEAPAPRNREFELRQLLRRFLDVCNAIDYAHSRGVLHRDIKPGNIIIGRYGETLVVDWGLAKSLGQADAGLQSGEESQLPYSVSGSIETMPGSALGTPAFMSPEQAEGDLARLGPRSDVYSLGATLYCLLTGKPPLEGNDIRAMLAAVRKGEFRAPRNLDPSIDKALECICMKAMALKPDDRYGTPRDLADDIEHWLADEPVKAYPEPQFERLGRWLRQHRAWTIAAVAALVGISLAATIGVVVVDRARRREGVVRKEAETNFNMALKAVDDYLTSVSENTLLQLQDSVDMRRLRQELLNTALKYYQGFVNERSQDPLLRRQLANALFRVGEITQEVESPNQAIEAYQRAQAIWEPLVAAHPADRALKYQLARSYFAVGKLRNIVGNIDLDGATRSLTRARAILEPLAAANPLEARYQSSLADCYSEIAAVQARMERSGESLFLLEKAQAIEKSLINQYPDKHAYQKSMAEITNVLGYAYYKMGRNDEAIQSFRQVQHICLNVLQQVTAGPKPLWLLNLVALAHFNIGSILKEKRELKDALLEFDQSVLYRSALVDSHPSVTEYKEKLGMGCREIAQVQHDAHEDAKAVQSMQRSVDVLKALVHEQPDQAGYHSELGLSWNYLGCLYDNARNNTEAIVVFERAVAEQQLAVDKANESERYRGYLANHLENLAEQYVDVGRVAVGLKPYRRSLQIFRDLSAAHPENRDYALWLVRSLIRLGTIERHDGDSAGAHASFIEARTILERWSGAAPADTSLRVLLGAALDQEASTLFDQGLAEEAKRRLERALVLLRPGPNHGTSDKESAVERRSHGEVLYILGLAPDVGDASALERGLRSEALWDLARVLRALNLLADAENADQERVALWQDRPTTELVDLAFRQLETALAIGFGKTSVSDRARAVRELDLDQCAANLRLAIARGFRDLPRLQSHPESQFVLSREELKLPIMDMAFPDRPFCSQ
jgi:eukaryotic-like serine/threonine-protein kinase